MASLLSSTALGSSASFSEGFAKNPAQSIGTSLPSYLIALASSDQSGTVWIDQSVDGTNVIRSDSQATSSDNGPQGGQSGILKVEVICPYVRVRYSNGSTSQTRFSLVKSWTRV